MKTRQYFVYILTNKTNKVLYTGVTNSLASRVYSHKNKLSSGFTSKYNISKLVYYEVFNEIYEAIKREKQIKNWKRDWKIELIKSLNPKFDDLYELIL